MHENQLDTPKANILVVDDDPGNLRLLVGILAEQGYKVRPASDGEFALEFARSTPPDLILLDIKMSGMDGYAVCEKLKADERTRDIPVIFISALDEVFDKVRAFALGGVDYITKPFQPEEVLTRVETHVTLSHYREHLEELVEKRTSELKYAHDRYRAFVKNSGEGIWRVEFEQPIDLDLPEDEQFELVYKHGYIAEANDAYARHVGFEHGEELVGTKIEEFAPRSVPRNVESVKAWIRGRYTISDAEAVESYKDGIRRNILNNSVGIIEAGRVVRVWGTHRDITSQRELEKGLRQSRDFNQAVLMSLPDHIVALDRQGTILAVNES